MSVILSDRNGLLKVEGELNFMTSPQATEEAVSLYLSSSTIEILDLSSANLRDSSGLSFIVELLRVAEKSQRNLRVQNIPHNMQAVVDVYGLEDLLPLSSFQQAN